MASKGSDDLKRSMKSAENDEPTAKTPRKTPTFFDPVPKELLLKVFKKLPSETRIHMRKTCSFMNSFVEDNRKSLAKTYLSSGISVNVIVENDEVVFKRCRVGEPSFPMSKFEEKMSGLPINFLDLDVKGDSPFEIVEETFKDLNILATHVIIRATERTERFNPKHLLTFANLVDVVKCFQFSIGPFDLVECLTFLQQSRNVNKIHIGAEDAVISMDIDRTVVELMQHFQSFHFVLNDLFFFKTFLWGLKSCHVFCTIKDVEIDFSSIDHSVFDDNDYPSMKILWDLRSFDLHPTGAAYSVRLISSAEQWILIADHFSLYQEDFVYSNIIVVEFLNKGDELGLLDLLIGKIDNHYFWRKFTPEMKQIYLNSDCEARFEMLRRAYFDIVKEEGHFDEEEFLTYKEYLEKNNLTDMRNL